MKRYMLWGLLTAVGTVNIAAAQQPGPIVIAVLPFEDRGSYGQDKEVFRALEFGIPATFASELSRHPRVRVADRGRTRQAVQAQKLGPNARMDAATAAKVGSEAGAQYAVTGNFADFYGKFRVDARLVDVGTGQILKVVSNSEPNLQDRADLSRIIQSLAEKVLRALNLPAAGNAAGARPGPVPTDALTQYSLGLLYESEGNKTKAGEHYQRALTTFPEYSAAREGMQRVR
jgi:TolB-like protein